MKKRKVGWFRFVFRVKVSHLLDLGVKFLLQLAFFSRVKSSRATQLRFFLRDTIIAL